MSPPDRVTHADGPASLLDGNGAASANARVALLVGDLRRRLRPACRDWEEAEFEAVIQQIARIKLRWTDAGFDG
jgi:hypothetical protein